MFKMVRTRPQITNSIANNVIITTPFKLDRFYLSKTTYEGCDFFFFVDYAKINQTYLEDGEHEKTISTITVIAFSFW